jgi:N-acetylglucosamine kinase-like BadF-type ATPase
MPSITVGVDAGGSKTAVVHAVDGARSGVAVREGANASSRGAEAAAAIIADAVESSLDGAAPHAIFVGAAGAARQEVRDAIAGALQSRYPSARVAVRDDAYIALRTAVPEGDGAVLIAGTGSIAYAQRGAQSFRCGGYGYLLGDDGSGFAIGSAGICHMLRSYDERILRDDLVEALEAHLNVHDLHGVLHTVYRGENPVGTVAAAARVVLDVAQAGGRSATKIVQGAALALGDLVKSVVKRSGLAGTSAPIVLAGGMLQSNSLLTYLLETRLLNEHPSMPVTKLTAEPCFGALAEAQQLLIS